MEKYVKNIKDFVIQALTNGSEIKAKAESGDALSCFQMGMTHLIGIDTVVDFNKSCQYLENKSLESDSDANRLLGFIAECEGNYSSAFQNYAKASGNDSKQSYIDKVIKERGALLKDFKDFDLPIVLNKNISAILDDYKKGGKSKVDASIRIAILCEDQPSCILAAQSLCEAQDYYMASQWLQSGKVPSSNPLYATIEKKMVASKRGLTQSSMIEVIELEGNELLADFDVPSSYTNTKQACDKVSSSNKQQWMDLTSQMTNNIKKKLEEAEEARRKQAEEARRKEEEARRKEEEARRKAEEARRKQAEEARRKEEEARRKAEEARRKEEEARRKKEAEARRKKEAEARRKKAEEARKKKEDEERRKKEGKKKKAKRTCDICMIIGYISSLILFSYALLKMTDGSEHIGMVDMLAGMFTVNFFTCIPFILIWVLVRYRISKKYR